MESTSREEKRRSHKERKEEPVSLTFPPLAIIIIIVVINIDGFGWRQRTNGRKETWSQRLSSNDQIGWLGTIHKGRPYRGGAGGGPKADIVKEVAWILNCRSALNADKG